jgi:hypothetical protein
MGQEKNGRIREKKKALEPEMAEFDKNGRI